MIAKSNEVLLKRTRKFKVVCADTETFVVAPMTYQNKKQCWRTDFALLTAYSNIPSINSLSDLGFQKISA